MENKYQAQLIRKLRKMFVGCIILKNDSSYLQGVPDLLILWNDRWAALECKDDAGSREQPNQRYYVNLMDRMSFAAFTFPENEEDVLRELQRSFTSRRSARFPVG